MLRQLTRVFDRLQAAFDSPRHKRLLSLGLVVAFVAALAVIELARVGLLGERLAAALPRNHFHAIELAFYLLLAYEVTSLTFAIARSVSTAAGKQFEIFSLILLRRSFEAFAELDEPIRWPQAQDAVLHMVSDAAGGLLLFVGLGFFYGLQKHRPLSADVEERERFIAAKKVIALLLIGALVVLALRSAWGVVTSLHPTAFFEPFYTVLIFADVMVVLISIRYSTSYHAVFRNSGLAVATVMLRLALSSPPPYTSLLGVAGIVFALGLTAAYERFAPVLKRVEGEEALGSR
ncbi:MAG: hypothetical protein AB1938_17290 [Myxococcota bacterium]